jgi:Flp pilus assembly protein TadD
MKGLLKAGLSLLLMSGLFAVPAYAEPTVVTSEGKYVMGDLDSKKDAKALALMEAKRLALEKTGTYLQSVSEVKDFQLTKDQVSSLAAGIMSVEVLKEDWRMSGENMMVTILIRATVDTSHLKDHMASIRDDERNVEDYKNIQNQLATLQKELSELKTQNAAQASGKGKEPAKQEAREKHEGIIKKMSALESLEKGNAALAAGSWSDALSAFTQAIALDPQAGDAYTGQATALQHMGKLNEALDSIHIALKLRPGLARNHAVKAAILKDREDYDQALASINKAIDLNPERPRFFLLRGEIYGKLQRPNLAIRDLIRACKMGNKIACERLKKQNLKKRVRPESN